MRLFTFHRNLRNALRYLLLFVTIIVFLSVLNVSRSFNDRDYLFANLMSFNSISELEFV